jgi:16S rRNA (guanine(527)-N(7))-methyltransferase RsmG
MKNPEFSPNGLWSAFAEREQLTQAQLQQFQHYYTLLTTWNQRINLTRIIELPDVLNYHFSDSLRFADCLPDSKKSVSLVDVGSGAGFPGIPLAIKYPHFTVTLLEVTQKKVIFLQEIIAVLGLTNVTIDMRDWRTYIHHVHDSLDYVCARASLQVPELMRIFQEGPRFAQTQVVYWASQQWELPAEYASALVRDYGYQVGDKKRRLIFLKQLTRSVRKG